MSPIWTSSSKEQHMAIPPYRPRPDMDLVSKAAKRLQAAQRPVIIAGGGARVSGAGAELIALAEKLSIPVATSTGAYALVPDDHPLYFGVPGTYSRACSNQVMMRTDLVLFVGSETGGQVPFLAVSRSRNRGHPNRNRCQRPGPELPKLGFRTRRCQDRARGAPGFGPAQSSNAMGVRSAKAGGGLAH